jgi:hypothetical protein
MTAGLLCSLWLKKLLQFFSPMRSHRLHRKQYAKAKNKKIHRNDVIVYALCVYTQYMRTLCTCYIKVVEHNKNHYYFLRKPRAKKPGIYSALFAHLSTKFYYPYILHILQVTVYTRTRKIKIAAIEKLTRFFTTPAINITLPVCILLAYVSVTYGLNFGC